MFNIQGVSRLYGITAGGDFLGFLIKKVHINLCPILDGYGVMGVFQFPYTPSCELRLTAGVSCTHIMDAAEVIRNSDKLLGATHAVHNRGAACVAAGCGIFENQV